MKSITLIAWANAYARVLRGDLVLGFYMVHLGENPGHAQLLAGDVVQLEGLLPESTVVRRFQANRNQDRPTRLTAEEARTLLEELRSLTEQSLEGKYYRSTNPARVTTRQDMVEGFIEFLEAELGEVSTS